MMTRNRMSEDELHAAFRALADDSRRRILDIVKERPGLSVGELAAFFEFSRFAVMKHLRILSEANLLKIEKQGRFRCIYLNAIPIQMIYDRWISKYSKHWARSLTRLKYEVEGNVGDNTSVEQKVKQVYTIYVRTTAERLWDALVKADLTPEWFGGLAVEFEPKVGASLVYTRPGPEGNKLTMVAGSVLECERNKKLSYSFKLMMEPKAAADRASRVQYEIQAAGELVKLTVTHDEFDGETATHMGTAQGWPMFLSSLKTYLETGAALKLPEMS
jgi:uncharacterized protein YndB with AHSA1/START domain/predicted transcriptional regulator